MQYQRTKNAGVLASPANPPLNNLTMAIRHCLPAILWLLAIWMAPSANAQTSTAFIRFTGTQERITVGVNTTNSNTITNTVNLSGGATNASFDVSGLPASASYSLTDTNGNPLTYTTEDTNLWLTVYTTNVAEGTYVFRLNSGGTDTNGLPVTNSFPYVLQAAHIWNGSLNTSNAWSTASSWLTGVPGVNNDVVFTDIGAQTNSFPDTSGLSFTNSFVDTDTIIGSLRFAQTGITNFSTIATNPPPIFHHLQILAGKTLTISGTNGFSMLRDYYDEANTDLKAVTVTIDGGPGAKLVVSNLTANVSMLEGAGLIPVLNMSNLDIFIAKVGRLAIADYRVYPNYVDLNAALNVGHDTNTYSARPRQMSANVSWAKTNTFTATYVDPFNYTNEMNRQYGLTLANNEQSGVGSSQTGQQFVMGTTNIFFMDGICFYGANGNSSSGGGVKFGPTNGGAFFRNQDGTSRMSVFTISDDGGTNTAASNIKGTVDFSAGIVNLLVDRIYLARDREVIQTNQTPNVQADLIVGKGTVDANTVILGFQEHTKLDWTILGGGQAYLNYCEGRLALTNGGLFKVNGTMTLGYTADTNVAANAQQYNTYGRVSIYSNSIVAVSNIVVDGGLNYYDPNNRQNQISINSGGTLIVSNSIGGNNYAGSQYPTFANPGLPGLPLDNLTMAPGSTLTLFVTPGKTNVFVRNFASTGIAPGIIKIASLPTFPVYPTNISLISYSVATPVLAADMSSISGNVQGYILNNSANQTIDLFLTTNAPRTLVWTGGVDNQWNLSTPNWVPQGGGAATAYSMGDIAIFNDSSSVTNIDITTVVVPNQATNGVVITNSTHIYTFNPAGGSIAGTAKIIKQGTNVLNFNAAESGPITVTAGIVNVAGILGSTTLSSNTVLTVMSGGLVSGVTETNSLIRVTSGGTIGGAIALVGGLLVNDGTVNIPSGTLALVVTNNAIVTNSASGLMNISGTSNPGGEVFAGCSFANFGSFTVGGARLLVDGTFFGTGLFYDNVNQPSSSAFGRLQIDSTPTALLSPGTNPTNSIGNMYAGVRLDLHASGPNNSVGKLLVEVDTVNNVYDTITAVRWNNIGCIWAMTNVNGTFQSGQSFRVLVNANGVGTPNLVDTANIFPLMQPTIPGPGLQWNLTGIQQFGTVGVTNSTMVWDGSGSSGGSWDTNGSTGNWKSSQVYSDNQGAIFDDNASGSTTVTLNSAVAPAGLNVVSVTNVVTGVSTNVVTTTNTPAFMPGIVVNNTAKDYTFVASAQTNRITGMTSIYKTGSGTLTVLSSNDFTGGVVLDGGTLAITNASALGGSVNQIYNELLIDNNATLKYYGSTNQALGKFVTINQNGATFEVSSNTTALTLNNNVLGTGPLTKTGPGMLILSQSGDAYVGTIVNAGTVRLTAAAAGTGTLTLNGNTTVELTNAFTLTNTVNLAGNGTTISLQGIATNIMTGPWIGGGSTTITSTNATRMLVFNNDLTGVTGTISFGTSIGLFRFNNRTNDSLTTGSATATFDLGTGSATLFNVSGTNQTYDLGALAGGANTVLFGSATNGGAASTTYNIGAKNVDSTFAGTISNGLDTVSIVKVGSGKLFLNGTSTYTGPTTVTTGTLGGSGSIASPLTVSAGGTLSPGAPIGTLTVNNTANLAGTVLMELNQANSPANDKLVVSGAITASGGLIVTNVGPDIVNGTKFQLFNKAVTGFAPITLPTSNPGHTSTYNWQNNITTDGSITLLTGGATSTVNTNPTNIIVSVSGTTMNLSWPSDHLGWQLLSNSVSLTATTQWFPVPGSTATTQENITLDPKGTNVFYRMVYPPLP